MTTTSMARKLRHSANSAGQGTSSDGHQAPLPVSMGVMRSPCARAVSTVIPVSQRPR